MGKEWEIKDMGDNEYFLGMHVQQDITQGTIQLTQRPYWEHVLNRFSLVNVPPRNTPLPVGIVLDQDMSPKTDSEKQKMVEKPYRPVLVGSTCNAPQRVSRLRSLYFLAFKPILGSNIGRAFYTSLDTPRILLTTA